MLGGIGLIEAFSLVTRNLHDFQYPGLALIDPWSETKA